ncbi:MAG: GNAT family N-acetyltransferase [Methylobacterium sp.]|nr:GNAT family N-acetyltransferase [Methylobacterium sp.]
MTHMHPPLRWRELRSTDLPAVKAIADQVHPSFPEDLAVFAERFQLYSPGLRLLEGDAGAVGYLVSHPWRSGTLPTLNERVVRIPLMTDSYYLHDLALLPVARGTGAANAVVTQMTEHARGAGFDLMSLVAVNGSTSFWQRHGFTIEANVALREKLGSYGPEACFMVRRMTPK